MTLAELISRSKSSPRMLMKTLLVVTVLRVGWLAITYHPTTATLAWALVPWPRPAFTSTAWAAGAALAFFQLRTAARLASLSLSRFAPQSTTAAVVSGTLDLVDWHLTPRERTTGPTALLLCGMLTLSCCAANWIGWMLVNVKWTPFDLFMRNPFTWYPLLTGLALSGLALLFGGRYIAKASDDIGTSFRVAMVDDNHWLAGRVHGIADRLDLPRPAVGITDVMNAFAMGANPKSSTVVIGMPLFSFEKDELDAIIGHELGHVLHKDVARMQFAEGFQRALISAVDIATLIMSLMGSSAAKDRQGARRSKLFARGGGLVARHTLFIASELVAKGISRNREFHADAVGAHVTSPDAMARALKRVHGVADKPTAEERHYGYLMFRGSRLGRLFSTHPPLQARLKALDDHARSEQTDKVTLAAASAALDQPRALSVTGTNSTEVGLSLAPPRLGTSRGGPPQKSRAAAVALFAKRNARRLLAVTATCVVLAVVAPAVISFYGLDRRFDDAKVAAGHAFSSTWASVVKTKETWFGSDAQEQVRSLSDQLARVTADRDDIARQNALLLQTNTDLKDRVYTLAKDRDKLDRKLQELQPPAASSIPTEPQGGFGALAAGENGAVVLTAQSFATQQAASDAAVADCYRFSEGSHCDVKQVFHNTCAALARVSPATLKSPYELQTARTIEDAHVAALSRCSWANSGQLCEVVRKTCAW